MILDRLHPALLAVLGIGVLSAMDALIKVVGARYPTFQLVFLRFSFGFVIATLVWLWMRPPRPSREAIKANTLRGFIGLATATSFFYALQTLPLAETIAFSFLSPLFLAGFGALLLGEKLGTGILIGLAVGFAGMLVMVAGQGSFGAGSAGGALPLSGVLAATGSAVTYALSLVLLRQRAQQDALITIVTFQHIVPCVMMAIPAMLVWVTPTPLDLAIYFVMAIMGVCGHLLMGMAFRRAEASRLAITEYSALLYATVLGFIFFDEVPGIATLAGTVLIVIGTLLAMRERGNLVEPPVDPAP
jgi:drug/metabolite transporter (DMT)-like permease